MIIDPFSVSKPSASNVGTFPYKALCKGMDLQDEHQKTWWRQTGPILAKILVSADYDLLEQQDYLTFYSRVLIPLLGRYPPTCCGSVTRSGLPLAFSVTYQQRNARRPMVRVEYEPAASISGTRDPRNLDHVNVLLARLKQLNMPDYDDTLSVEFLRIHDSGDGEREGWKGRREVEERASQAAFGFDFKGGGISVEGYMFPTRECAAKGQPGASGVAESVQTLMRETDYSASFTIINDYMAESHGCGQSAFFSWDCCPLAEARLRLYSSHDRVAWSKIEDIWTLGGRVASPVVARGLGYLEKLWELAKPPWSDRAFTGGCNDGVKSPSIRMFWSYEIKPGDPVPRTRFYLPVHGQNGQVVIRGLAHFLEEIGLVEYGNRYEQTVQGYFPGRDLATTSGLTSWIGFAYSEETGVCLSVYYHSSLEHPWLEEDIKGGIHAQGDIR